MSNFHSVPFHCENSPFSQKWLIDLISSGDRTMSVAGHRLDLSLSLSLFLYPRYPRVPCKIHSPFITIMTLRSLCSPAESFMPSRGTTFVECSSATVRLTCISRGNLPSLKRTEVAFHGSFEIPASSSRSGLLSFFHLCFHSVLVETGRKTRPCKV